MCRAAKFCSHPVIRSSLASQCVTDCSAKRHQRLFFCRKTTTGNVAHSLVVFSAVCNRVVTIDPKTAFVPASCHHGANNNCRLIARPDNTHGVHRRAIGTHRKLEKRSTLAKEACFLTDLFATEGARKTNAGEQRQRALQKSY